MTRTGKRLLAGGFCIWLMAPVLWVLTDLSLSTSLFIGSTALLPFLIWLGTRKAN